MNNILKIGIALVCFGFFPLGANSQTTVIDLEAAMQAAIENNRGLKASYQNLEATRALVGAGVNIEKTQVFYRHDQNDIAENGISNRVWGLSQNAQFPTVYGLQKRVLKDLSEVRYQEFEMEKTQLLKEVSQTYYTILYWQEMENNFRFLDSLYAQFSKAANLRFTTGETNYLEKVTAETKKREMAVKLAQATESKKQTYQRLEQLIQTDGPFVIKEIPLEPLAVQDAIWTNHPGLGLFQRNLELRKDNMQLEKNRLLPDLSAEVFRGTNNGMNAKVYPGVQFGVAVPLWFGPQKAKIQASRLEWNQATFALDNYSFQLENRRQQLEIELQKFQEAVSFYQNEGKNLSRQLIIQGTLAFQNGEIDFLQYVLLIENSRNIELDYLFNLQGYNMTVLEINYLIQP
ncbi:TolC family protein [Cecembia calidifontis]|jgi:cobalt-zinc-cadmium resistance protein CzcA|uniref:Outer membrane protein TolC n=1 Tax=Cecembia calidifontis TaxID=1187080 RepID=A0A4Q7P5L7_9BACT|nr:TolC family protein [Cecembia calidifontis]RZS95251.1 outer membrane protein TolC [Cecembia calidifontis]